MKKTCKGFVMGFLSAAIILASFSFAQTRWQSIYVAFNAAEVQVNGKKLDSDIITYEGTTYAPVKELSQALGKEVEWNEQTKTVTVNNSPISMGSLFGDISAFVQTMLGVIVGGIITYIVIVKRAIKHLKSERKTMPNSNS